MCVCVGLCVFMCVQLISLLLRARCVFFSSWSTSTWGCNMHFTSLLSVTPAVGFKALLILCVCVCVHVCAIDLPFTKSFRCVFLVAGRLRRGVVICISLPFYQLHQLWVLKHCLYCGCVCVCVCAIDLPFTKSFRCFF